MADITLGRTGLNTVRVVKSKIEELQIQINTLLFMIPGYDDEHPNKGCNLKMYTYIPDDDVTKMEIKDKIREQIEMYLDANLVNVDITTSGENDEYGDITISFMKDKESYLYNFNPNAGTTNLVINRA